MFAARLSLAATCWSRAMTRAAGRASRAATAGDIIHNASEAIISTDDSAHHRAGQSGRGRHVRHHRRSTCRAARWRSFIAPLPSRERRRRPADYFGDGSRPRRAPRHRLRGHRHARQRRNASRSKARSPRAATTAHRSTPSSCATSPSASGAGKADRARTTSCASCRRRCRPSAKKSAPTSRANCTTTSASCWPRCAWT